MIKIILAAGVLLTPKAFSLEVDKRQVARILDVSDTKKTILLSKGKEDGLQVGDHAKISLPEGVIAHGELNKISPGRSVWSLYKIYRHEKIGLKVVVTLKIIPPVKLIKDETRDYSFFAEEKDDERNPASKEKVKTIKKRVSKKKASVQHDQVDYSSLDDPGYPLPLNPEVDWSGVRNIENHEKEKTHLDFSNLY